jgi:uncharacterized membrane protein
MYQPYATPAPRPRRPVWPWVLVAGIFATFVVILLYLFYWAPSPTGRPYLGYYGGGLFLLLLLFFAGMFALRVAFWSAYRGRGRGYYGRGNRPLRDPAIMAARQRYARGEITREQFDQIMTDLTRRPRGPPGP